MESLKIKVTIANRVYPLTINPADEENIRKAVKTIEERIKLYEQSFEARDTQDLLSMCLLEVTSKLLLEDTKLKVDNSLQDSLNELESLIDKEI